MSQADMKLLVVEDNDLDVIVLQRLMRRMRIDYPVVRATNGEEALRILRPAGSDAGILPPYIMLVDINMPRMNGFELLEALVDDEMMKQIPTYIMTTSNSPRDTEKANEFEIEGYLVKPVTEPDMKEVLSACCDGAN